jgi:hypothetical protein
LNLPRLPAAELGVEVFPLKLLRALPELGHRARRVASR